MTESPTATNPAPPPSYTASAIVWRWRDDADGSGAGGAAHRAAAATAARRQGSIGGAVGLTVAAAAYLLLHRRGLAAVIAGLALVVSLLAVASPLGLYRRLRIVLDGFAHVIGTATTWVLMTVLFYLLFLPAGLVLRAMGKLDFVRFREPARASYWTATEDRNKPADSYRKQF
jgi:hypothetical protein